MQVERDLVMQMRRRRDGDGVDAELEQRVEVGDRRAAEHAGRRGRAAADPDRRRRRVHARQSGEHAGVVGAHDADADDADAQRLSALSFTARTMSDAIPSNGLECPDRP